MSVAKFDQSTYTCSVYQIAVIKYGYIDLCET